MIILDATTKSLQLKLGGAITTNQLPFSASYVDSTGSTTTPGEQDGASNNATAVTIVGSPASSTQRLVKSIVIQNADTAAATVTIIYNNNSTLRNIIVATLAVGDQLIYEDGNGWSAVDTNGNLKTSGSGGGSAVSQVTNSDGTLTISPTTGNVVASLAPLASGKLLVGNGSNVGAAVAMSGDATLANTGALTLDTVNSNVGSFTNANLTVNAKGQVTAASNGSGSGAAAGTLFNLQQGQLTTPFTTTASSFTALTGLSVSITPTSSSSSVLVRAVIQWGGGVPDLVYFQLVRGSTPIGVATSVGSRAAVGSSGVASNTATLTTTVLEWLDSPATTSATTYSVQGYSNGGTGLSINASVVDSNSSAYPRGASTITVCEVHS